MEGKTQDQAAAMAGMSVRSARAWEAGPLPSASKTPRAWRTRSDPFAGVWERDIAPLLEADKAGIRKAPTILDELARLYPKRFGPHHVRTLQRRLRDWKALHGRPREVIFPQVHPPGREAAIDFTHGDTLGITIAGFAFPHLLFEFVLSFSGWTWVGLAFRETFEALVACLQGALWALEGVPTIVRSDNLSAATHELRGGGRALTRRYRQVLEHYRLRSTRIEPGEAHQNGVVEQRHYRTKSAVAQALVLRGSKDFATREDYLAFVRAVVDRTHNDACAERLVTERRALAALPSAPLPCFTVVEVVVRQWSTIRVGHGLYSVPSRLIGYTVEARVYAETIEVHYGGKVVETMPRVPRKGDHRIDYRHVIWSLVRKPGAFAHYRFREELFPSLVFRRAYDALCEWHGSRADIEYVRILHLAASTFEAHVATALASLLATAQRFDYAMVKALATHEAPTLPVVRLPAPDLSVYDRLLAGGAL